MIADRRLERLLLFFILGFEIQHRTCFVLSVSNTLETLDNNNNRASSSSCTRFRIRMGPKWSTGVSHDLKKKKKTSRKTWSFFKTGFSLRNHFVCFSNNAQEPASLKRGWMKVYLLQWDLAWLLCYLGSLLKTIEATKSNKQALKLQPLFLSEARLRKWGCKRKKKKAHEPKNVRLGKKTTEKRLASNHDV